MHNPTPPHSPEAEQPLHHVLALSGGKDSTALALRMKELHPELDMTYVCTPTGDELPDMVEHMKKVECLLGKPIVNVCGLTMHELVQKKAMLPNWRARFCTQMLKIWPFMKWLQDHTPAVVYVGIRADEDHRGKGIYEGVEGVTLRHPFVEWGWTKADVVAYLQSLGITIPRRGDCARCFFQTMSEWWRLWADHPDIFRDACMDEFVVTGMRGKPCTYRNAKKDQWPTALWALGAAFERGKVPKNKHGIPANQVEMDMDDERDVMCSFCAR